MPSLPDLASSLGVPPSTLRQGARVGYVRAEHLFVESGEAAYLRSHWSLLRSLTASLGQERGLALALLCGSRARGDDGPRSDVDLLIAWRRPRARTGSIDLSLRLQRALPCDVDVMDLADVEKRSPALLVRALREGRVLVSREGAFEALRGRESAILRRARREHVASCTKAREALVSLAGDGPWAAGPRPTLERDGRGDLDRTRIALVSMSRGAPALSLALAPFLGPSGGLRASAVRAASDASDPHDLLSLAAVEGGMLSISRSLRALLGATARHLGLPVASWIERADVEALAEILRREGCLSPAQARLLLSVDRASRSLSSLDGDEVAEARCARALERCLPGLVRSWAEWATARGLRLA